VALIEALIGMMIFAFGVLGLVGLQASVTQAQTSGKFRAEASNLVDDLFGLVQTDHASNFGKYNDASCASYARCADWRHKVLKTLPAADVAFVTNAATGSVAVTLSWQQGQQSRNTFSSSIAWQP
jgi:type IV pilus assembly protein PilV